ncbi:hypothetical protein [Pontiella sulfatireligans]|uniref:Uncharacterized protein n=1 Tax=Pontiella sulfatireligans TaxID=2750658 RepID=A0A6C2UL97_9BACT|nr:hypothetical protein [Pontiella sulfatireligans]VGO20074.1 hypothetical protein SCARR_02134 [Pontiella sulfatireligans]
MSLADLTKEQKQYALIGLLVAAALIALIGFGIRLSLKSISAAKLELQNLVGKIENADRALAHEDIAQELESSIEALKGFMVKLPPNRNYYSWASEVIYSIAREASLDIDAIDEVGLHNSLDAEEGIKLESYSLRITARGGYENSKQFLRLVEEQHPFARFTGIEINKGASPEMHEIQLFLQWPFSLGVLEQQWDAIAARKQTLDKRVAKPLAEREKIPPPQPETPVAVAASQPAAAPESMLSAPSKKEPAPEPKAPVAEKAAPVRPVMPENAVAEPSPIVAQTPKPAVKPVEKPVAKPVLAPAPQPVVVQAPEPAPQRIPESVPVEPVVLADLSKSSEPAVEDPAKQTALTDPQLEELIGEPDAVEDLPEAPAPMLSGLEGLLGSIVLDVVEASESLPSTDSSQEDSGAVVQGDGKGASELGGLIESLSQEMVGPHLPKEDPMMEESVVEAVAMPQVEAAPVAEEDDLLEYIAQLPEEPAAPVVKEEDAPAEQSVDSSISAKKIESLLKKPVSKKQTSLSGFLDSIVEGKNENS